MNIQVVEIELCGENRVRAVFLVGATPVAADLVIDDLDGLRGFNFADIRMNVIAWLCPFCREFVDDLFDFFDGLAKPLPWVYGDFDESRIQDALETAESEHRRCSQSEMGSP